MIARLPDWNARMNDALKAAETQPFAWGAWDCCHFVAAIVKAMTGVDPLADYRGEYADEAGAWAALAARDGNLRSACKRVFGGMVVGPFAKRGDVVMLRGGKAIGICIGTHAAFASDDGAGLVYAPMTDCPYAFPLAWPGAE